MVNSKPPRELDEFEKKIISIMSTNGRIPVTELAKHIGLSKSPCQARLKRLESEGFILGYRTILSAAKLQKEHVCFAEVKLTMTTEKALGAFNDAVANVPEIEECHMIASSFDYLLKIRTKDINTYRKVLADSITALPYVASTSTHVSMQSIKDSAF